MAHPWCISLYLVMVPAFCFAFCTGGRIRKEVDINRYITNTLRKGRGYKHALIKNYTTRWNKVLRHDIGHSGKSTRCSELGWVSIEEFLRNDHAWPRDDPSAYNHSTRSYKEEVLHSRRRILMEGYWYTLNCKPIKRRLSCLKICRPFFPLPIWGNDSN